MGSLMNVWAFRMENHESCVRFVDLFAKMLSETMVSRAVENECQVGNRLEFELSGTSYKLTVIPTDTPWSNSVGGSEKENVSGKLIFKLVESRSETVLFAGKIREQIVQKDHYFAVSKDAHSKNDADWLRMTSSTEFLTVLDLMVYASTMK